MVRRVIFIAVVYTVMDTVRKKGFGVRVVIPVVETILLFRADRRSLDTIICNYSR